MKIKCTDCGKELKELGAIELTQGEITVLISPPIEDRVFILSNKANIPSGEYKKEHICVDCFIASDIVEEKARHPC